MKNTIKKSAIVVVGVFAIALVFGNTLLAQERNSGSLVVTDDIAFITGGSNETVTPVAPATASVGSVISVSDLAFVSQPFAETAGDRKSVDSEESAGVITVADYRFVSGTSAADCDVFENALACANN